MIPPTGLPHFQHASFSGRIGIARTADITPQVGIYSRNWGAAKHDVAESIHRPLTLTALALAPHQQDGTKDVEDEDKAIDSQGKSISERSTYMEGKLKGASISERSTYGETMCVLVDADLGWWKTPSTFAEFQRRILEELSLDSGRFLFALSHTHAGPPLMQPEAELPGGELLQHWMTQLIAATVDTVRKACQSMFPATLDWHTGKCSLATNRDLPDPQVDASSGTSARTLCGFNPAEAPDDTLVVGRITDSQGLLRATLVNYACHPTTLAAENKAISPDYVGAMRETIEQATSSPALFMLGMCGDLAPRYQYVGDAAVADRHGRQLGHAALATLHDMEPSGTSLAYCGALESGAPLALWRHQPRELPGQLRVVQRRVDLPLKDWPTADELERQRLACNDRAFEERLRRRRDIRRGIGDGQSYELSIYAWRIGEAVLVGSCCEPYSFVQQELRRRFPAQTIVCMNLVNGSIGYMPPAALYDSDVYPVWQTPFARGCMEKTLEGMTGAINDVLNG